MSPKLSSRSVPCFSVFPAALCLALLSTPAHAILNRCTFETVDPATVPNGPVVTAEIALSYAKSGPAAVEIALPGGPGNWLHFSARDARFLRRTLDASIFTIRNVDRARGITVELEVQAYDRGGWNGGRTELDSLLVRGRNGFFQSYAYPHGACFLIWPSAVLLGR